MLTYLIRTINELEFGLVNIDIFIIRIEFGLVNVDTTRILTRYEYELPPQPKCVINKILKVK